MPLAWSSSSSWVVYFNNSSPLFFVSEPSLAILFPSKLAFCLRGWPPPSSFSSGDLQRSLMDEWTPPQHEVPLNFKGPAGTHQLAERGNQSGKDRQKNHGRNLQTEERMWFFFLSFICSLPRHLAPPSAAGAWLCVLHRSARDTCCEKMLPCLFSAGDDSLRNTHGTV